MNMPYNSIKLEYLFAQPSHVTQKPGIELILLPHSCNKQTHIIPENMKHAVKINKTS